MIVFGSRDGVRTGRAGWRAGWRARGRGKGWLLCTQSTREYMIRGIWCEHAVVWRDAHLPEGFLRWNRWKPSRNGCASIGRHGHFVPCMVGRQYLTRGGGYRVVAGGASAHRACQCFCRPISFCKYGSCGGPGSVGARFPHSVQTGRGKASGFIPLTVCMCVCFRVVFFYRRLRRHLLAWGSLLCVVRKEMEGVLADALQIPVCLC